MNIEDFGLGRTVKSEEKAFSLYPLRSAMPRKASKRKFRYWYKGWQGDQGETSQCVAYSWLHLLHAGPVTMKGIKPVLSPGMLYNECQKIDEWPGEDYDGTSVNAGAKVLLQKGYLKEYRWAFTIEEMVYALLEVGPAVIGTDWPYGFFFPNKDGILEMKGRNAGGHAYACIGVNVEKELFKIQNSWSNQWGVNGCAYLRFADLEKLMDSYGEFAIPIENKI